MTLLLPLIAIVGGPTRIVRAENVTFVVDSTADEPWDGTPGTCVSAPSGLCTLRAALESGPATPPGDVIVDVRGLAGQTIELQSELSFGTFGGSVAIVGPAERSQRVGITPAAGVLTRVLDFTGESLTLSGLSIRGGFADSVGNEPGGGLQAVANTVTLENVEVVGNEATLDGGGIYVLGSLIVSDSTIRDNVSGGAGGGVSVGSSFGITITRTDISGNRAAAFGGGIALRVGVGAGALVSDSIVDGNFTDGDGGGIWCSNCDDEFSTLDLDGVSVVDNTAAIGGGGVAAGHLSATNATISDNTASDNGALEVTGGVLRHTTVTGNVAPTAIGVAGTMAVESSVLADSCAGTLEVAAGDSVIVGACAVGGPGQVSTLLPPLASLEPLGGVLTGYGREIPVVVPSGGISLGGATCRATTDTRGAGRPTVDCDHGAVEIDPVVPDLALVVDDAGDSEDTLVGDGICADALGRCTLRAAVMEADAFESIDTIDVDAGLGGPIVLTLPPCAFPVAWARCADLDIRRGTVTISGPPGGITVDSSFRIFDIATDVTIERLDLSGGSAGEGGGGGVVRIAPGPVSGPPYVTVVAIRDSRLRDGTESIGGALAVTGAAWVELTDVAIDGNNSLGGGALDFRSGSPCISLPYCGRLDMTRVRLTNNVMNGGGLNLDVDGPVRIADSVLRGNRANAGSALLCACRDLRLDRVSISGNTDSQFGAVSLSAVPIGSPGAVFADVNVSGNTGRSAAVIVNPGDGSTTEGSRLRIERSTIADNVAVGGVAFPGGGLEVRTSGTPASVTVTDSIIASNVGFADGTENCLGPITAEGAVFIPINGCSVSGATIDTRDPQIDATTDVAVMSTGALYATGPVPVVRPALTSPVVDAVACTPSSTSDLLGTARPQGLACDAGAIEGLGIELRLLPDAAAVTAPGASIPLSALGPDAVAPEPIPGSLLLGPTVDGQDVRSIDLARSPLGRIPLGRIDFGSLPLGRIPLGRISLSSIPVSIAGGWDSLLVGTPLEGIPPQNITFAELIDTVPASQLDEITLDTLDLRATSLGSIPLGAIAYANVPLGRIPLDGLGTDWCTLLTPLLEPPLSCGPGADVDPDDDRTTLLALSLVGVPLGRIPLGSIPLGRIDLSESPLGRISLLELSPEALQASPLGRIPLGRIDLGDTPLGRIDIDGTPLGRIPLGRIDVESIPLGRIPLGRIDFESSPLGRIPLGRIPLGRIDLATSPLGRIPLGRIDLATSPLGRIPLGRIDLATSPLGRIALADLSTSQLAATVDCVAFDCTATGATLRTAAEAGALVDGVALADLGYYADVTLAALLGLTELDGVELADLGYYADVVLAALLGLVELDGIELADLGYYGDVVLADLVGTAEFDQIELGALGVGSLADLLGWLDPLVLDLTIWEFLQGLSDEAVAELTLGDLLQGLVPPDQYPWEDLDLDAVNRQLAEGGLGGDVTFVLEIESYADPETDYRVDLDLPSGFRYVDDSLDYPGVVRSVTQRDDGAGVTAVVEPVDELTRLVVRAQAPLTVGTTGRASATLTTQLAGQEFVVTATGIDQVVSEAFEPNDTRESATPLVPRALYLTHIVEAGDVDWFSIDLAQGEALSLILSNLAADLDLTIFGPAEAPLRGAAEGVVVPAADQGRSLLAEGTISAAQVGDDIDTTPPSGSSLVAVSASRGTSDERIDVPAARAGTYYIRVEGYLGAASPQPYGLRASVAAPRFGIACPPLELPAAPDPLPALDTTLGADLTTLVIVNRSRLAAQPGSDEVFASIDRFLQSVNAPAPFPGPDPFGDEVAGVFDVDAVDVVRAAYDAWDADPCNPARANGVVSAIGAEIDAVLASHTDVENLILVGADDQIPFARLIDPTVYSNEREYAGEIGDRQSPLTTALSLGYLFSDDPYGDANPVSIGTRELFVPELAVGRLVESPGEISTALDTYVEFRGRLDPTTALSTGYDFLSDGALAVSDELGANGLVVDEIVDDEWTAGDLRTALLGGQEAPDIASLNAHFDHYRALPADQNRAGTLTDLFTIDDIGAAGSADLSRVLLFSMGCHAGLSVSDVAVGGPRIDDWAQTLLGAGATFAGNTGFGYGDDTIVGATEELMRRFAAGLDGSLTVGGAMAAAKQQYLASTATITPFDEKVASQVVVYGMPQLRVGGDAPVAPPSGPQALPDYAGTGLDAAPLVIDAGTGPSGPVQPVRTPRGNYYAFDGMTQSTADQPVQPKTLIDVTQDDGRRVRGALLTALESSDVDLPDPVYFTPAIDLGATAPEVSTTTSLFPSRLQRIARYESPTGPRDQAIVVTGQFRGDPSDSTGGGTQRLFTQIGAVAFVAPTDGPGAGDESPPTIDDVEAVLDGDGLLRVRVRATDDTGIALVTILHTDAADPGSWTEATLPAAGGGIHSAALAVPAGVETIDYFVQVVDVGGNVAVSSNKGAFFRSVVSGPPTIEIDGPFDTVTGWYQGPVEVSVTPFVPNGDVSVTVNGSPSDSTFTLDAEGAYEIVAVSPGGEVTRRQARLDATAPVLTVSSSPATRPSASPVTVSFSAGDNGSGVASLRYSTDGAFESGPVTIVGATGSIVVGSAGVTTIEAVAVDRLGHESPPTRLIVEVTETADVVAPTVVCGAVPTDWQDSNVRITCTSDDTDLADAEQASFDLATTVPRGVETSTAFTGATSVCDTATNCTRAGPLGPLRIDRRPPDIVVAYPLEGEVIVLGDDVTADVSCSDSGSGVATCSSTALDTSTVGARALTATAIDSVGNVRTMTIHYEVRFAFGGFIDPVTEPPNLNTGKAGRTYPIKFTLNDASGAPVRDIASVVSVTYRSRGCNGGPVSDDEAAAASNSRGLRLTTDGYSYNWRTPRTPGCYQVTVLLADDTRHVAEFRLR